MSIRFYTNTFSANQVIEVAIPGSFVRCITGAAIFEVALVSEFGDDFSQLQEGIGFLSDRPFQRLLVKNGATAQTIALYVASGVVEDSRLYGSVDSKETSYDDMTLADDATLNAAAETTIAAASRRSITIQADINNTTNLRAGPSDSVDDTNGLIMTPGSSYTFYTTRAIKVRNPTGGDAAQGYRYYYEHD